MKWVAGTLMMAFAALIGFSSESQALTGNKPQIQVGTFHTLTFAASATVPHLCNTDSMADPLTATTSEIVAGMVVHGFSVVSMTAGGVAALFDEDDIHDLAAETSVSTKCVDEIGEATQYDTVYTDWVAPVRLTRGFTLQTLNAPVVKVYYD